MIEAWRHRFERIDGSMGKWLLSDEPLPADDKARTWPKFEEEPLGKIGALSDSQIITLLAIRDALVEGDVFEAYHQLYSLADPTFSEYEPWAEWEERVKNLG